MDNLMGDTIVYLPLDEVDRGREPQMRFRLYYDGELRSDQKKTEDNEDPISLAQHKQKIRKKFHTQLKQLWATNQFLREHKVHRTDYTTGKSSPKDAKQYVDAPLALVDAIALQYVENGYRFVPLVRGDLTLLCNLHVLFLRRDYPGAGLISAGDIDNRIKTLVDGLTKPLGGGQLGGLQPEAGEDPFFCLLESDSLVNSLTVETDALLSPPRNGDGSSNWVRLVITVELRPYHVTPFNLGFA